MAANMAMVSSRQFSNTSTATSSSANSMYEDTGTSLQEPGDDGSESIQVGNWGDEPWYVKIRNAVIRTTVDVLYNTFTTGLGIVHSV
jgi:hypothetical protein